MNNLDVISKDHEALFSPVIDAYELTQARFKKKYRFQRINNLNISEICDAFDTYIPELVKTKRGRCFIQKIVEGLQKIQYIRLEFLNNKSKGILERFTARGPPVRERNASKNSGKGKSKGHRIKTKEEDSDSSVMFISQDSELILINAEKDFKVDKDVKDKNLIEEIEEPNVDNEVFEANYFGPASKEEIRFTWDEPVEGLNLNKTKKHDKGKYGMFSRAEEQVLKDIKTPCTTPLKRNRINDATSNGDAVLSDILINNEGNFADFPQRMGEALSEVQITPKRKPVDGRNTLGTPSKRSRIDDSKSNGDAALPDILINDEGNFADFPQRMGEALPEVQTTPKRKPVDDGDVAKTPTKRSRRSLNEEWGKLKTESLDDCWVLPDLEESENKVKKSKKKKKYRNVFDEHKTIYLNITNVHTATVPVEKTRINPRNILTPAGKLFQMPSSIFAGSKRPKPINQTLLGLFQNVIFYPPPPIVQNDSKNSSDLQPLPPVAENVSQLRVPPSNNNLLLSTVKAEPAEDLPSIEETRHNLKDTVEPLALDSKAEVDTFPIEDVGPGEYITDRSFNKTHPVNSRLPPTDSLGQYQDTVPIEDIERNFVGDDPDDPDWDSEYVYQRIKQLCEGGVRITFRDLAPIPDTKKMNRILAFEYILHLKTEEKICLEQSLETETITIWLPEE